MCIVIVASLATFIALVTRASRRPGGERGKSRRVQPMRGLVQGGEFVGGGGRAVMPRRDEEVPPGGGTPPSPEEMEQAEGTRPRSGSPMDL
jgi:hypothetical protein